MMTEWCTGFNKHTDMSKIHSVGTLLGTPLQANAIQYNSLAIVSNKVPNKPSNVPDKEATECAYSVLTFSQ